MELWDTPQLEVESREPIVLRSDDGAARAIAVRLAAGEQLQEHEVHEHCYVLVACGEVDVGTDGATHRVTTGGLAHFEPHERRSIAAIKDSRVVMILAPWPGEGHYT